MSQKAMILAAGFGKRMLPLTERMPKPLIPVAGKSMLERTLEHVQRAGIKEIVVNSHHFAEQIHERVSNICPEALISHEEEILETGGGIKKALPLLGNEPFFTLNGDSIWTGPNSLEHMRSLWDDAKMDALLLVIPKEKAHGYEGRGDFFLSTKGQLSRPEKGEEAPYVYIGVQYVHPRIFTNAPDGAYSMNVLWNEALAKGRLYGCVHEGEWFHMSTPEDLEKYEAVIQGLSLI